MIGLTMNIGDAGDTPRDRAIGVFKFLRDLAELRSKTIRDIALYDAVWWLSDLPRENGCHYIGWHPVAEVDPATPWVEIRKPKIKPPPPLPQSLQPWIVPEQLLDSNIDRPELQQMIEVFDEQDPVAKVVVIEECPDVIAVWEQYIEKQWRPWAENDRIQQRIQLEYSNLFSIYQKQKTLGENYEVVFCFGFFTWRSNTGYEVARHLITAQISISFDDVRGIISVGPASDGARLTLEQDMLDAGDRPEVDDIEQQLRDSEFVMWDSQTIPNDLKGWVNRLSAKGEYSDALTNQTSRGSTPMLTLAPAIVMRRRGERSILRLFKDLIEKFEKGAQPSIGIERLVSIIDERLEFQDNREAAAPDTKADAEELYLPLPSNPEQRLIVDRLQQRQGILVQGPPGTGKSHTIANLLCHLLAHGKRVLVTSHTARALAVLKRKLPPEIADLCVLLLGNDLTALQGLENSVREITERYNTRNDEDSKKRIAKLEQLLDGTRQAEAKAHQTLRSLREAATYTHQLDGYAGTTQAIAQQLREQELTYGWLLSLVSENSPSPLSDKESLELLNLRTTIDELKVAQIQNPRPESNDLLEPMEFDKRLLAVERTQSRRDALLTSNDPQLSSKFLRLNNDNLGRIRAGVGKLTNAVNALKSSDLWLTSCLKDLIARNSHVWVELFATTNRHLSKIGDRGRWAADRTVTGLDGLDLANVLADASGLQQHLQNGGGLGIGPFKSAPVKRARYIIQSIRVDGIPCKTAPAVDNLRVWLAISCELQTLDRTWSHLVETSSAAIGMRCAHVANLRDKLKNVLEVSGLVESVDSLWRELGHSEPLWVNSDDLERLAQSLEFAWADREFEETINPLHLLLERLRQITRSASSHEVTTRLLNAAEFRDSRAYDAAYQSLIAIEEDARRLQRRRELSQRLSEAAPKLLSYMNSENDSELLKERFQNLTSAWRWVQAELWLKHMTDPSLQQTLESESGRNKRKIREYLTQLAAEKAWAWCFHSMTEKQRRHLVSWQLEIKKLGKGTGKHAATHRRNAREELDGARGAVPAWIMPIYRVAETLKVDSDQFDGVIVDEASQSRPDAMFLLEFAKQIIIVGDDKQIKPDVFVDQTVVDMLRRRHIPNVPSSTLIGSADTSLFEIGDLLYGGRVRLREHFRCMPGIIQFLNKLCYVSEPLIPLKQFGASRLKPVVSARHVPGGYQKGPTGRVVNPPEAEAIVDFISGAIHDNRYAKKSFGVISLLGDDQAKLIEQMLLERVGPEEIQRRNLVCGDAYAFQGDERDVMLLSMVSAPAERVHIGVLAKPADERRFNVAASRAKEIGR